MNDPRAIEHFLSLARHGRPNTGASSGEVRARRLALSIIENAPGLDEEAIAGAVRFLQAASISPNMARDLIEARLPAERAR